jgi:hypothetical protein
MAPAIPALARWRRDGLGRAASHRLLRRDLDTLSGGRLCRRRSAPRYAGGLDAGAAFRVGLPQASAIDRLGCRELERHLSAQRVVAAIDGDDQCRACAGLCRPDRAAIRDGAQARPGAVAPDADAGLSIPCPALQCQCGAASRLAAGDLVLPARIRDPLGVVGDRRGGHDGAGHGRQILFDLPCRELHVCRAGASGATRLFHVRLALDLGRRRACGAVTACSLARHDGGTDLHLRAEPCQRHCGELAR